MEASIRLGRIWGIPIGLHHSWFLIFALVSWSLAVGFFPQEYPEVSTAVHWISGIVTSILFFVSVLLHELGHAYLALRNKIAVRAITLFIFGGVAQIESEPKTAGAELRITLAGPLVSFALGGIFYGIWWLDQGIPWLAAPSLWLGRINLLLGAFNLIPGFPLDGGRILRAIVWHYTRDFQRATRTASFSGQLVAFGFIGYGIFAVISGNFLSGLWLIFIGWFLQNAAAASYAQVRTEHLFADLRVRDAMIRHWEEIPSKTPLSLLIEERVLQGGPRYYFVARDGYGHAEDDKRPYGMLSLTDVTRVSRSNWPFTPADQVMIPWEQLVVVHPDTPLLEALRIMDSANVAQVPVLENGQLVGILSRERLMHYVNVRAQLKL